MEGSPSKLRIKQLSERLLSLQSGLEVERNTRVEGFQSKLKNLDSKVDSTTVTFDSKFKLLKEQLAKLNESLSQERTQRETLDERKSKELKLVENNLNIDLNLLKQGRKDYEAKVNKLLDEKLFNLRLELAKEKKNQRRSFRTTVPTTRRKHQQTQLHCRVRSSTKRRRLGKTAVARAGRIQQV